MKKKHPLVRKVSGFFRKGAGKRKVRGGRGRKRKQAHQVRKRKERNYLLAEKGSHAEEKEARTVKTKKRGNFSK